VIHVFFDNYNYSCPTCGKLFNSEREAQNHCRDIANTKTCPDCNGTGKKVDGLLGAYKCDRCEGSGYVTINHWF